MARIFISHNSQDAREAVALKQWLAESGWDDVFLDIDYKDGLSPGERWKDALRTAADHCEAVLCLVSPTWLASAECKLEFRYAEQLRKHIFLAVVKPCDPRDLPPDWQWCLLHGDGAQTAINFEFRERPVECTFLSAGLERLKYGLEKAGIGAEYFPWPPEFDPARAPYRGLKPLEAVDAAVFFGRDAQILHGLETLRDMSRTGIERLLVILGASGSGKSSFMRAGLLPRLERDNRQFFPLPVVRPRNAVLSGADGLASALAGALASRGDCLTLGKIEKWLAAGPEAFGALLSRLEQRLNLSDDCESHAPSFVLLIDQAEELFNPDGAAEAAPFLDLLGEMLADRDTQDESVSARRRSLVVLTIRSDRYERLQMVQGLSEIKPRLFDLRPFPPNQFERVINGPAERATAVGRRLKIEPQLSDRLLADFSEGADTLPLLGFTLEKLYLKYGGDGDITLDEYHDVRGSHETVQAAIFQEAIDTALAEPFRPPIIPSERNEQFQGLRRAFIPYLARINPENNESMRQVAKLAELPGDVHPLVERLVEARLLIRDKDSIEVAHESLLRQWPTLRGWLTEDLDKLRQLAAIQHAAAEWRHENQREDLLVHRGGRLIDAERLLAAPGYVVAADSDERAYLNACTAAQQARDAAIKEEQDRRVRDAEQIAEQQTKVAEEEKKAAEAQRRAAKASRQFAYGACVALVVVIFLGLWAYQSKVEAQRQTKRATTALAESERELLRAQSAELRGMALRVDKLVAEIPNNPEHRDELVALETERRSLTERLAETTGRYLAKLGQEIGFRGDYAFLMKWEGNAGGVKLAGKTVMIDPATYLYSEKPDVIRKRYEFILTPAELQALVAVTGKSGAEAEAAFNANPILARIQITSADVARLVPEVTAYYWKIILERHPVLVIPDVPAPVHTALLSIATNMGPRQVDKFGSLIDGRKWLQLADQIEAIGTGNPIYSKFPALKLAHKLRRTEEANLIRLAVGSPPGASDPPAVPTKPE